jgi:c-di-GMP-related signal transduction protein
MEPTEWTGVSVTDSPLPTAHGDHEREVHVGRQPIYNRRQELVAYELLFRGTRDAERAELDGDSATTNVILNTFTEFGLEQLVGPRLALINVTRPFVVGTYAVPFEPTHTVLEILETITVDDEVVAGARRLTERGYALALDDFVWRAAAEPLLPLVSYVKIDIQADPPDRVAETLERCRAFDVQTVAERVETADQLAWCQELGFDLFQGFYLGRPQVVSAPALSPAQVQCLELLNELARPNLTLKELEAFVLRDPGLSYRTLQAANSAAAGAKHKLRSVRAALVQLGLQRLRSWVALMAVSDTMNARGRAPCSRSRAGRRRATRRSPSDS